MLKSCLFLVLGHPNTGGVNSSFTSSIPITRAPNGSFNVDLKHCFDYDPEPLERDPFDDSILPSFRAFQVQSFVGENVNFLQMRWVPRGMRQSLSLFAAWHMMCYTLVVCLTHLLNRLRRHLQTFPETFPVAFLLQTFPVVFLFLFLILSHLPAKKFFAPLSSAVVVVSPLPLCNPLTLRKWTHLLHCITPWKVTPIVIPIEIPARMRKLSLNSPFQLISFSSSVLGSLANDGLFESRVSFASVKSAHSTNLMLLFSLNVKNYLHGTFLLTPKLPLPFLSYHVILHLTPPPFIVFQLSLLLLPKFLPCWWYFNLCIYSQACIF